MKSELEEVVNLGVDALCLLVIGGAVAFGGLAALNRLGSAIKKSGENWRPPEKTLKERARWTTYDILILITLACLVLGLLASWR